MRRLIVTAVAVALLLAAGTAPAAADPLRSKQAVAFDITCGGETLSVVITGGIPAHVGGGTGSLLLRSISLTDLTTSETRAYSIGQGKQVGLQDSFEACSGTFVIPETGVTYTFDAVVTRVPRGA